MSFTNIVKKKDLLLFLFVFNYAAFAEWDAYPTYSEYVAMMERFESDYPDLCKIIEFGTTVKGRNLLCAKISDNIQVKEAEPGFLYSSSIHGDETAGYVLTLRLIDYLLSNYGTDARVTKLVDSMEIWINPLFNPDGTFAQHPDSKHTNGNDVDLDRNFPSPAGDPIDSLQPETMAMIALADSVRFVMSANFQGGSELVSYPPDFRSSGVFPSADVNWWKYISHSYTDLTQENSPSGYMTQEDNGVTNGGDWYVRRNTRMDYMNYFAHCRELTIELSMRKQLEASKLPAHWEYNYRSLLGYMEQALYGIRGTVVDDMTHDRIPAKVFIENHDKDSSHVFATLPYGDYYRPIAAGTYTVTFSSEDFDSKTITDVKVANNKATVLDVELSREMSVKNPAIKKGSSGQWLTGNGAETIELYDLMGRKVKTFFAHDFVNWKESSGVYIVRLRGKGFARQMKMVIK